MLADMEEKFGKARNVLAAYEKAISAVLPEEKIHVCISKYFHFIICGHNLKNTIPSVLFINSHTGLRYLR